MKTSEKLFERNFVENESTKKVETPELSHKLGFTGVIYMSYPNFRVEQKTSNLIKVCFR